MVRDARDTVFSTSARWIPVRRAAIGRAADVRSHQGLRGLALACVARGIVKCGPDMAGG